MGLVTEDRGSYHWIRMEGYLNGTSEESVEILTWLAETGKDPQADYVLDLSSADYLGSPILAALVRFLSSVKRCGRQVVLLTSNPRHHAILEMTGLNEVFTILSDPQQIESALRGDPIPSLASSSTSPPPEIHDLSSSDL